MGCCCCLLRSLLRLPCSLRSLRSLRSPRSLRRSPRLLPDERISSISTRSLLMRARFFFDSLELESPFGEESSRRISFMMASFICLRWSMRWRSFSSRSFLRSSFDFFFGRVLWLRAARSIRPMTLILLTGSVRLILKIVSSCASSFCTGSAGFSSIEDLESVAGLGATGADSLDTSLGAASACGCVAAVGCEGAGVATWGA